jgi:hypothetical protein
MNYTIDELLVTYRGRTYTVQDVKYHFEPGADGSDGLVCDEAVVDDENEPPLSDTKFDDAIDDAIRAHHKKAQKETP